MIVLDENTGRIYRIGVEGTLGDNSFNAAVSPPVLRNTLINDYPEIINATRVKNFDFPGFKIWRKSF